MKISKIKKAFAFILTFIIMISPIMFGSEEYIAAAAASTGIPHYEKSDVPYEYYQSSNASYYEKLASPTAGVYELPKLPDGSYVPPINKIGNYPLNYKMWMQKGLVVYIKGDQIKKIPGNTFHCGYEEKDPSQPSGHKQYYGDGYFVVDLNEVSCVEHGKSCPTRVGTKVRGEWRYLGYDVNNNRFENMNYIMEHATTIDGRMWIKEPWNEANRGKTGLTNGMSIYNRAVYQEDINSEKVRQWIDKTMNGWGPDGYPAVPYITSFNDTTTYYDPEVYKYLYIKSAPTIMRPGEGVMYHQRPTKVYPSSFTVPVLTDKNMPDVQCTVKADYYSDVYETELDKDTKITVDVEGLLKDEFIFEKSAEEQDVLKTIHYNRYEIKEWKFKVTLLNNNYAQTEPTNDTNKQATKFIEIYVPQRELNNGFYINAEVQPVFMDGKLGKVGKATIYVKAGIQPLPEETKKEEFLIDIPTLKIDNSIPEVAFDNIPFEGAVDNTDMSFVTNVSVNVGGTPVDYDLFFSGNYIFPRTTNRNGYMTYVEITYTLDKDAIILSGISEEAKAKIMSFPILQYKSVDVVYVYPTTPYVHFTLSSNSWKENRVINLTNDSVNYNLPFVLSRFPIVEYKWYYGGDTTKLYKGTDTDLQKQLQYSEPGQYSITLQAKNSLGQWSEPYTYVFYVLEDYEPAIELNLTDSVVTRQDEISAWHYNITSTDGDRIASAKIELWYDSNGDNVADTKLAEWNGLGSNGICELTDFPKYTPTKLGLYVYKIYATEEFVGVEGQETLSQYVTVADKKTAYYEVNWWVDNYQPLSDLYIDAPIERPKVDLYIMLDKNLNDTKRETIVSNRVTYENKLLSNNIIPNIAVWDMKTYTYSQPASSSRNTGTTYPPSTITYESNGYSGTLTRNSVSDNGSYKDFGRWVTVTESKSVSDSDSQSGIFCPTCNPSGISPKHPTSGSKYYSDSQGYSGYLSTSYNYSSAHYGTCSKCGGDMTLFARTWYWSGTVTRTTQVWEKDERWVSDYTGYYSGTIYKDVRQPYTDPYSGGETIKYILYLSDNIVNELSDLQMAKGKSDAKLILSGTSGIKSQIGHDYYIDVTGKQITEIMDLALEYINQSCPDIEQIYILQGETFNLQLAHFDIEGDEIIESQLQYVHEYNYFDNPTGQEAGTVTVFNKNSGWTTEVKNKFMNVGKYRIFRRVKDKPNGTLGDLYSYYSGATELDIYVHRKPIADAVLDWTYNPSTGLCETIWADKSYDLDHTSLPDKGIVERKIMFRKNGGEWLYYIPSTLSYGTYDVKYYVKDMEGSWSEPWEMTFTLNNQPQLSASARAKSPEFSLNSIPASETIELYNIWTRQPGQVRLEFSMAKTPSSTGSDLSKANVTFTQGVTGTQNGQDINWYNQDVVVPSNFKDGATTLYLTARDVSSGAATTLPFTVNVYTPINLTSPIEGKTLRTTEAVTIEAATTKYPNTTTVQLQYGTSYQSSVLNMTGTLTGQQKKWTTTYSIPANVPEGNYNARFVSTNPSGKQEIKLIQYKVIHNRPPIVTITGTNPKLVYEGDNVSVKFKPNDEDLQQLTYTVVMTGNGSTVTKTGTVSPNSGIYPEVVVPLKDNIPTGNYSITVTVKDTYNESATATYNYAVLPLSVTGSVSHTATWEANRQKFNISKTNDPNNPRGTMVFWSGERFVLQAVPTTIQTGSSVTVNSIKVEILNQPYLPTDLYKSGANWVGELWDASMVDKWGNAAPINLTFRFTCTYSNGTVKTDDVIVTIDNREPYHLINQGW